MAVRPYTYHIERKFLIRIKIPINMPWTKIAAYVSILSLCAYAVPHWTEMAPTIAIGVLVRNKEFALPYFFYYLEKLDYQKSRMGVVIYEDHSFDESAEIVRQWCLRNEQRYAFMDCVYNVSHGRGYPDEITSTDWSFDRMQNVINLRERLLLESRRRWADFLLMLDADVLLVNVDTLGLLIGILQAEKGAIVSPLLNFTSLPTYSNFWDEMSQEGFYVRSDRYLDIKERIIQGTFSVPLVNTALLVDLNHIESSSVSFVRKLEKRNSSDDLVNLALNCKERKVRLLIYNGHTFGYSTGPLLKSSEDFSREWKNFLDLQITYLLYHNRNDTVPLKGLNYLKSLQKTLKVHEKLNVEKTFVINLERRLDRNIIVSHILNIINVPFSFFRAVDGLNLSKELLTLRGMRQLNGYLDPFYKRGLTYGEVGCFLSHFTLWETMVFKNITMMLIFEDDIKVKSDFVEVVNELLAEADILSPSWDFLYLGRKVMRPDDETYVQGSRRLVIPNYSYRTTGYILNRSGAEKLLNEGPLQKMVALDEFIPIMYGKNPHKEWLHHFTGQGSLNALAAHPSVVEPSHFKGHPEYFSDTELSDIAFP